MTGDASMEVRELPLAQANEKLQELYREYVEAVSKNDYDRALELGSEIVEELLRLAHEYVIPSLTTPLARSVASKIVSHHEKALAFVKGAREAAKSTPVLYSFGVKEKAVEVLTATINGLFSFVMGALIVLSDILAIRRASEQKREKNNLVPRVL